LDRNRKLAGRRIIVTGAASGMGAATARLFAQHGATLTLFDMQEAALNAVGQETGGMPVAINLADGPAVTAAVEAAAQAMGGLDGIVNAAGILRLKPIADISFEEQDMLLRVNIGGVANMVRAALPHLQASGSGTIVNFASYGAYRPGTGLSIYGATKAGVIAMAKSLINDIGPKVRINTICPGVIQTPMNQPRIDSGHLGQDRMAAINQLGRYGQPEEVAEAVLFLTGPESSFMSNAVLEVSGGQLN
jgi:NAD(P)-dependent dehydrogenase (short-subunit alcohol dehydrogenase family)